MKNAKEFLELCHRRFPPPRPDLRHTLSLEKGVLVLTLMKNDYSCHRFNLDNEDLDKCAPQLLAELITIDRTPSKGAPKPPSSSPNSVA